MAKCRITQTVLLWLLLLRLCNSWSIRVHTFGVAYFQAFYNFFFFNFVLHMTFFQLQIFCANCFDLPITVRFIFRFLVGELRKSTRQRQTPSSSIRTLSIFNCAGCDELLKQARAPNAVGDDQRRAWPNCRPRTSKLKKEIQKLYFYRRIMSERLLKSISQ